MDDVGARFREFKDPELGQVLVLDPALEFDAIVDALTQIGLSRDPIDRTISTLPGGGPAVATFSIDGAAPRITYSCNPVVNLKVLEVGTASPFLRGKIADVLALVPQAGVEAWISSGEERQMLRGFWAAVETERIDLMQIIARIGLDKKSLITSEANRAKDRLVDIDSARMSVLGSMGMVCEVGQQVTQSLCDPAALDAMLATPDDMADLFTPDISGAAADICDKHMLKMRKGPMLAAQSVEDIGAAPAGLLRGYSMLTRRFPIGLRDVAGWMVPNVIWLCWTGRDPNHGTMQFDGLAFTGERWLYCPRPHRILMQALPQKIRRVVLAGG
ncbi:MAG: hypothetical protein WA790_01360 [Sulfitobacter sp.]